MSIPNETRHITTLERMRARLREAPQILGGESGTVWVHSDLQLGNPDLAREILTRAVDDLLTLNLDIGAVWCLGDALIGHNQPDLEQVAAINIEQLARLDVPVCFMMGNHEMDIKKAGQLTRFPLVELAKKEAHWHTKESQDDFFFARDFCGTLVVFMGDHIALDDGWWTTHGLVKGVVYGYPHSAEVYAALRDAMAEELRPVITVSHYAYPGGQRPSALMGQMLPLPESVRLHLYGHAHIGDLVHNRERPWQRDNPINGQSLRQFNISALENKRSPGSHSALLEIGPDGPAIMRIRCHLERRWVETFDLSSEQAKVL